MSGKWQKHTQVCLVGNTHILLSHSRLTMALSPEFLLTAAANQSFNNLFHAQENSINDTVSVSSKATSADDTAETIMLVFKIIVGIAGILGNAMVCVVLSKMRSEKVNFLICSQAIIDLAISVIFVAYAFGRDLYEIPTPRHHTRGYIHCLLWKWTTLIYWLFSISTYNLIAISIDRYISIIHPLWYLGNFTRNKTILLGCCSWLLGPIFQIVLSVTHISYLAHNGRCKWSRYHPNGRIIMGIWLFIWDFFMPCMIMAYCSTRICLVVMSQKKHDRSLTTHVITSDSGAEVTARAEARRSRSVTITFVVVVIAYIVCWSPNQLTFLYINISGSYYSTKRSLRLFGHAMSQLNSAINPFIYVFCMREYIEKAKSIFCKSSRNATVHPQSSLYSSRTGEPVPLSQITHLQSHS